MQFYWRSSWADDATAFAFKAGTPEGHATAEKVIAFPDWRLSSGHAHLDAGGFIIWSKGRYLTGDSGYAGVPLMEHHNTLKFDGQGQGNEGKGHDAFAGVSYERLNKIKITGVNFSDGGVQIIADPAAAYEPKVGVEQIVRTFSFTAPGKFQNRRFRPNVETDEDHILQFTPTTSLRNETAFSNLNRVNQVWRSRDRRAGCFFGGRREKHSHRTRPGCVDKREKKRTRSKARDFDTGKGRPASK